jgi:hypothetical protein
VQTANAPTHEASSGQFALDEHSGAQKPWPFASVAQCCSVPDALGAQSWSTLHVAQYCRGRQSARVGPNDRVDVVTFGATSTTSHHHPPAQSVSFVQPKSVQKALASAGDVP